MEIYENNTRITFDYRLKYLIHKLRTEKQDLMTSLKNDDYKMLQDTQKQIRNYFVEHQNEINIAGILRHHYQNCPDFFALLCAVIANLDECNCWEDVWKQLTNASNATHTLYDASGVDLFAFINFEEDFNEKTVIKCMCSHNCCPENMSILTNHQTKLRILIACDCLEKTGIISSYNFKKKAKMNDSYAKIMYNKSIRKLNKSTTKQKWSQFVETLIDKINEYRKCKSCELLKIKKTEADYVTMCKSCYINKQSYFKTGVCYLVKTK